MKKVFCIILALALCLSSFAMIAEEVAEEVEVEAVRSPGTHIIIPYPEDDDCVIDVEEDTIEFLDEEIEKISEQGENEFFKNLFYLDWEAGDTKYPLEEGDVTLITVLPLKFTEVNSDKEKLRILSEVPEEYADLLVEEGTKAVFVFTREDGTQLASMIDYEIVMINGKTLIRYYIDTDIAKASVGCKGMICFVKVSDHAA